jgi:hypothetical protein
LSSLNFLTIRDGRPWTHYRTDVSDKFSDGRGGWTVEPFADTIRAKGKIALFENDWDGVPGHPDKRGRAIGIFNVKAGSVVAESGRLEFDIEPKRVCSLY